MKNLGYCYFEIQNDLKPFYEKSWLFILKDLKAERLNGLKLGEKF